MPRPAIKVYQNLVSVTPALITPFFELCVVGPVYQVVRDKLFTNDSGAGANYAAGTAFQSDYVDKVTGAVVDQDFVGCTMKETMLKVWPAYSAVSDQLNYPVTVDNTDKVTKITYADNLKGFLLAGVVAGDIAYVTVDDLIYTCTIQSVTDTLNILLAKNIPTPVDNVGKTFDGTLTVIRPAAADLALTKTTHFTVSETALSIPNSITTTVGATTHRIFSGKAYATYRALRPDMAGDFTTINDTNDALAKIGKTDIANPMSVAANVAFQNTSAAFKILGLRTDDKDGYLAALDILGTSESVYVIVPLSNDRDVVSAYANHCRDMSTGEKSKFRIMYGNLEMPLTKVIVELNAGLMTRLDAEEVVTIWDYANGMFVTNGGLVNDYVDIYDETNVYMYSLKIVDILNDSVATCGISIFDKTVEGYVQRTGGTSEVALATNATIKYEVVRKLDTSGIADTLIEVAQSFSNKRLRLVMPDLVQIAINETDYDAPGYYLCVAFGSMRAGFPPHQGFSTLGIGGIKRLYRSNRYFKTTAFDKMIDGGLFWTVQDDPAALPYCVYQSTTDITQLEVKEDSCVATVDYVSRYFKTNLKPVLGKFNVNAISVKYVSTVLKNIGEKLMNMSYSYIGPVLLGFKINSITTDADKIKPSVKINIPFPVNEVDIDLQV